MGTPDSYGLLLLLLVVDYIILSLGLTESWASFLTTAFTCLTVLLAFRTSQIGGRWLLTVRMAASVAVAASIVVSFDSSRRAEGVMFALVALLVFASPVAIVSRLVHHTRVTAQTLLGAMCIYVLIGLVFAYADMAVQLLSDTFFAQSGNHNPSDFVYFSFVTMTTVGYGDLTPTTGLARTMAVTEALTGQVFLVVLVARLVAMYSPQPGESRFRAIREARSGTGQGEPEEPPGGGDQ